MAKRRNSQPITPSAPRSASPSSPEDGAAASAIRARGGVPHWTFLTNHTHVLILLKQDQSMVLREVAARVGITERAVQRIIAELEEGGYLERHRVGRQNHYRVLDNQPLRHPIESHRTLRELLDMIALPDNSA